MGGDKEDSMMKPEVIVPSVVCGVLFLIVVFVLVLCRHRLPRTLGCCAAGGASEQRTNAQHYTEGNHGEPHYEEIQMQNQQASAGGVLPSVYATVNPPADQLHYASVNFQKDSVLTDRNAISDMNKTVSSACDYSITRFHGATYPALAEQTLYSTVTKPGEA
ncbi:hypothetical protein ABVT39_009899 [Epinephelus coioides]